MTTIVVRYMPQIEHVGEWIDVFNGLGFPDEAEAQRFVEHSALAARYVRRVMTETASIPVLPEQLKGDPKNPYECPSVTVPEGQKPHNATALAVQARDGLVEVGWSRYTIEQADELIAAVHRAQLKAAEQR